MKYSYFIICLVFIRISSSSASSSKKLNRPHMALRLSFAHPLLSSSHVSKSDNTPYLATAVPHLGSPWILISNALVIKIEVRGPQCGHQNPAQAEGEKRRSWS